MSKCRYCSNSYSFKGGSTANLNRHLKRKHAIQYECASRKRQPVLINQYNDVDGPISCQPSTSNQPSTSQTQIYNSSENINTIQPPSLIKTFVQPKQKHIESFITKPLSVLKSKKIDEQLAIMIAKEFQPYSIVEDIEICKSFKFWLLITKQKNLIKYYYSTVVYYN